MTSRKLKKEESKKPLIQCKCMTKSTGEQCSNHVLMVGGICGIHQRTGCREFISVAARREQLSNQGAYLSPNLRSTKPSAQKRVTELKGKFEHAGRVAKSSASKNINKTREEIRKDVAALDELVHVEGIPDELKKIVGGAAKKLEKTIEYKGPHHPNDHPAMQKRLEALEIESDKLKRQEKNKSLPKKERELLERKRKEVRSQIEELEDELIPEPEEK